MCEERFKSHSRTERVEPHQPHRKNSIYNQKVQNSTPEVTGHGQGTEQGPTEHTPRKFLQGIKQPPSNTDTRKAAVQHSQYQHRLCQRINPSLEGPKTPSGVWLGSPQVFPGRAMVSNPCTGKLELMQEGSALLDAAGISFGLDEGMVLCHSAHSCS